MILAAEPRVLARNAARRLALFKKPVSSMTRTASPSASICIRVPSAAAQDRLLTPWAGIARRLSAHPARPAGFASQKPVQKPSRRRRLRWNKGPIRPFASRSEDTQSSSVVSIDAPTSHDGDPGRRFPGSGRPPARKGYMPCWVRELHRRWRYFIPRVIWCLAIALFIAVWIYVALQTKG